jgi:hypothetical protein
MHGIRLGVSALSLSSFGTTLGWGIQFSALEFAFRERIELMDMDLAPRRCGKGIP